MSDEHATVLYKGHRYQMRKIDKAPCADCVFRRAGVDCDCPSTPEFGCCGADRYRWIEVINASIKE